MGRRKATHTGASGVCCCFGQMSSLLILLFSLVLVAADNCDNAFHVYGPGWDTPDLSLPSRYFFVEPPNNCSRHVAKVVVESLNPTKKCRTKHQILNDTFFESALTIIRYRLFDKTCEDGLRIVLYDQKDVEISRKELTNVIVADECDCPKEDAHLQLSCDAKPELYQQLDEDLRCYGEYVGFSQFFDDMMTSLLRKARLNDTQFLVNLGDWPLSSKKDKPLPIFSWCGSDDTYDIVLPTYEMTESVLKMQDRVSLDVLSVLGRQKTDFISKESKIFWRGRDSNKQRLLLVHLSKQNPQVIDAALTNFFFFRDESDLEKYGPRVSHTSFYDFFKYKYLINIDGTVAAYRLPNLLAGNSLVIKQDSKYYEHFYHLLKPHVHFIPVKEDLSNLPQVIKHLGIGENNDIAVKYSLQNQMQVIENSRKFVMKYLLPTDIFCYYLKAVSKYSNVLREAIGNVEVEPDDQFIPRGEKCLCTSANANKDEL